MKMIEEARSNWEETVSGTNRQDEEQRNQRPRGGDQQKQQDEVDQREEHLRAQGIHE